MREAVSSARVRERAAAPLPRRSAPEGFVSLVGGPPDPAIHPAAALAALAGELLGGNEPQVLGYGYEPGDERLRAAVAHRAARDGAKLGPDQVVLTNGSAGAIGLAALALVQPGDTVVAETLTYPAALKAFRQMGARIEVAPIDAGGLDPDGVAAAVRRTEAAGGRVKLIYTIATCHNPTGTILSLERRRALVSLAARHGALIVQDDTYGDIRFAAETPAPFIALAPERTVHLGSFSKTIAPGLRVGWIAAEAELCEVIARGRTDLGNSPLTQRIVARFIETNQFEPHLQKAIQLYHRKRDLMLDALERHCAGLATWTRPEGGFFLWLTLHHSEVDAVLAAAEQEKVSFLPGPHFSAEAPFTRHLRAAYGQVPEGQIEEGVARLGRALRRAAS